MTSVIKVWAWIMHKLGIYPVYKLKCGCRINIWYWIFTYRCEKHEKQ